ncbi:hypothetical protein FDECE_3473 [Fusarium decemcellulare]|nr:hypothetical protein FDECE_3473 [Fusarium decemcellulare]
MALPDKLSTSRSTSIFRRLLRYYDDFNTFAGLLGVMSLAAVIFGVVRADGVGTGLQIATGLLISSTITSITAITAATMLQFTLEGCEEPGCFEKVLAWLPLAMLSLVIMEFSAGLVFWYIDSCPAWIIRWAGVESSILLGGFVILTIWVWIQLSKSPRFAETNTIDGRSHAEDEKSAQGYRAASA